MVARIIFAFYLISASSVFADVAWRRYAENAKDVESSGTDFVPQFHPFHFGQPVFQQPQDLSLQQSQLIGFQHRFQQGFGPTAFNPPSLINPQPHLFQGQQSEVQQVLIPPQPTAVLNPPAQTPLRHHQQSLIFQQNPVDAFRNTQPQTLRNQGQNFRFPQQNFPSHDQTFATQQANFQRALPQQPFPSPQPQPQQPFPNRPPQQAFSNPPPQHPFPNRPPHQPLQNPPSQQPFPSPQPPQQFHQHQNGLNAQFQQQRPLIQPSTTTSPPLFNQQQQQQLVNQQQLLINHQQAILNQQQNFQQNFQQLGNTQGFQQQSNFIPFNQQKQNLNVNAPKATVFTQAPFHKEEAFRPNAIQNNVQRPVFEFQSAVQNQQPITNTQLAVTQPVTQPTENPNILFQKSQEGQQYRLGGNYLATTRDSQVTQTPRSTTVRNLATSTTTKPNRTPKTIVKEIRINLDEKGNPITDNPQLYIKESRQKQFQQIKQQQPKQQNQQQQSQQNLRKEKSQRLPSKDEKTQEELINEQIQKLLQRHNLEIIDKEKESSESQEAQLSQFSNVLKGKYPNYNVQLVSGGSILKDAVKDKKGATLVARSTTLPPLPDLPEHIKKDYDIKLVNRDDFFKQFDIIGGGASPKLGNNTLFLANGQELELVSLSPDGKMKKVPLGKKPSKKSLTSTTTVKPPKVLFEELAKGVIPPGADFELIRQNEKGEIEKVTDVSTAKKVTFVLLEEQPDGSVKVQGVKGNTNSDTSDKDSVNSILKKIKDGSLKLPPSTTTNTNSLLTNEISRIKPATIKSFVTLPPSTTAYKSTRYHVSTASPVPRYQSTPEVSTHRFQPTPEIPVQHFHSTPSPSHRYHSTLDFQSSVFQSTTASPISTEPIYDIYADINSITTESPTIPTRRTKQKTRISFLPTIPSPDSTVTSTFPSQRIKTTSSPVYLLRSTQTPKIKMPKRTLNKLSAKYEDSIFPRTEPTTFRTVDYGNTEVYTTLPDVIAEESNIDNMRPLIEILKDRGLNQMAKFLDQSGLDTILNETGPYTIFLPTDKAFKALEAQLGGTDRAEDKFRENPRLLSGLLLHHVVPGSFRVEDLQDEMTGVSLAGTQLRVNTYEDKKLKNQKIVTINGAKVSHDDRDIHVPQGLAHAVDRVLFPLPVGDILQTLRGDRERRFTKFIKSLEASGLTDKLTGSKTYTVFAPTDSAFSALTDAELDKLLTRREAARTIVMRHIVPGTLYGAGMQYYQLKETMEKGQKIAIYKDAGKIKANSAEVISSNIPATNGVIHVVETLL